MLNATELRRREVIDIATAERLGYVCDVEIDFKTGLIQSIVVPRRDSFFALLRRKSEFVIPWDNIAAIGKDIILVNVDHSCYYPADKYKSD